MNSVTLLFLFKCGNNMLELMLSTSQNVGLVKDSL